MNLIRAFSPRSILTLGIVATIALTAVPVTHAQFPYGPGYASSGFGYGGLGYGNVGYGFPGYGYGGGFGYPGYGVGYGSFAGYGYPAGVGVGSFAPGMLAGPGGYAYPGTLAGPGLGIPGYGPTGIGFANPLFGLGLSPLAVQTAAAERALVQGSVPVNRQTSAVPTTARTTRGFPAQLPNR